MNIISETAKRPEKIPALQRRQRLKIELKYFVGKFSKS